VPLYHQIANDLRRKIASGAWSAGSQMPSEEELTAAYGVSRITVRQALSILVQEGLVTRQPGRGSFVRDPSITAGPRRLTSFSEEMRAKGLTPSSRVLDSRVISADQALAEALQVVPGAPVLRLERLRLGNGEPIGIQVAHVPIDRYPGLDAVDFSVASLYAEMERRSGLPVEEAEETYIVGQADPQVASELSIAVGSPVLVVERRAWSGGVVVEFTRSIMRGDRYRIQVRLRRTGASVPDTHRRRSPGPRREAGGTMP
jgi:GntR family transcriptional regulator